MKISVVQDGGVDVDTKLQYDSSLLINVTEEEAKSFGGTFCQGMCKNPIYLAIVKLAATDCRGRREEESKWGSSFCFYDVWLKGKRAL